MMLGSYQRSHLRIEVDASAKQIGDSVTHPTQFRQWMWPQHIAETLPDTLQANLVFTSWLGPVPIRHEVLETTPTSCHLRLSQGIEGFHQWYWGDGWLQSSLEGYSLLPLNLGQSTSLLRLRYFLSRTNP